MSDGRTESVRVRFTADEKIAVAQRAQAAGMSMSDLVRGATLGTRDPGIGAPQAGPRQRATGSQSERPRKHKGNLYERIAARTQEIVETEGVSDVVAEQRARQEEGIGR